MTRRHVFCIGSILFTLALLLPVAAHSKDNKRAKNSAKTAIAFQNQVTLAGKQVNPGEYMVSADDSKVTISRAGKVIAEAPAQWKDEAGKAEYSQIVTEGSAITEIHFQGKTRYIALSQ